MGRETQFSSSGGGVTLVYICKICGETRDWQKRFPVFDFRRGLVHCGCVDD